MLYQELITVLDRNIKEEKIDFEIVREFYNQSIDFKRIHLARSVFDKLQNAFPNNREIRSLNIALGLEQKDYCFAIGNIEKLVATCTPDDGLIDAGLSVRAKLGPKRIHKSKIENNTISLCMIVKNEIRFIGSCLHWVKPLVDEIIVVDTGSTDRTKDVAQIFGARVYNYQWCEDFSSARNYSLEKAEGKWILILDADELIASSDNEKFFEFFEKHAHNSTGFIFETRNYTNISNTIGLNSNEGNYPKHEVGIGWFPSRKVRLFPNIQNIRFRYPVHEQVEFDLKSNNIPTILFPIPIHHYGDLNDQKKKIKAKKYFNLGYKKLEKFGNDFQSLHELASQAGQLEYWEEASELWKALLTKYPNFAEGYVNLSCACWQTGKYQDALETARIAQRLDGTIKEAYYNEAISLLLLEQARDATHILKKLIKRDNKYLAANFMYFVSMICIGDYCDIKSILKSYTKSNTGTILKAAIEDINCRFSNSGLFSYKENLEKWQSDNLENVSGINK